MNAPDRIWTDGRPCGSISHQEWMEPGYHQYIRADLAPEITDEMVERACDAYFYGDGYQWDEAKGADHVRLAMRAAITAALRA